MKRTEGSSESLNLSTDIVLCYLMTIDFCHDCAEILLGNLTLGYQFRVRLKSPFSCKTIPK